MVYELEGMRAGGREERGRERELNSGVRNQWGQEQVGSGSEGLGNFDVS